jgi:hypothetical protein
MKVSRKHFINVILVVSAFSTGCASLLGGGGGGGGSLPNISDLLNKIPPPPGTSLTSTYEQAMAQLPYLAVSKGNTVADGGYLYGNQNFH